MKLLTIRRPTNIGVHFLNIMVLVRPFKDHSLEQLLYIDDKIRQLCTCQTLETHVKHCGPLNDVIKTDLNSQTNVIKVAGWFVINL